MTRGIFEKGLERGKKNIEKREEREMCWLKLSEHNL
jgi:hypothetical protein